MVRQLPPLNALRAFESGARFLSFTRAAEDLSVTQTAISHQVRLLEDWFGKRLFVRSGRALALSEAGSTLYPVVAEALDRIAEVTGRVRGVTRRRTLTVTVTPTFGSRWLAQRLGRFWQAHPDLDLRLHHSVHLVDLTREDVDVAVRWGAGDWPAVIAERLMAAEATPMCSPALLDGHDALRDLQALARHTLLHERDYREWTEWLAAAGVPEVDGQRGPVIDDPSAIVRAALDGHGVMLGVPAMLNDEIDSGALVTPFGATPDPNLAYYLAYRPGALDRPKVRAFRDFLVDEVHAERSSRPGGNAPVEL